MITIDEQRITERYYTTLKSLSYITKNVKVMLDTPETHEKYETIMIRIGMLILSLVDDIGKNEIISPRKQVEEILNISIKSFPRGSRLKKRYYEMGFVELCTYSQEPIAECVNRAVLAAINGEYQIISNVIGLPA